MKKFMLGLLVGLLLTTTVFAFASSEQIQALLTNFNFVVNGQVQKLEIQPITYNGTSYLPVRELATILGYRVEYKADTRTIELSNKEVANTMSLDDKQWTSLKEIAKKGVNVVITPDNQLVLESKYNKISIKTDVLKENDTIEVILDSNNTINIKVENGTTYFLITELTQLRILD